MPPPAHSQGVREVFGGGGGYWFLRNANHQPRRNAREKGGGGGLSSVLPLKIQNEGSKERREWRVEN